MSNRQYKRWFTIHDANDFETEFCARGLAEVWARRPIGKECNLGALILPNYMEVQWLDDSDTSPISAIGTFGHIGLNKLLASIPKNEWRTSYQWFINPLSEAEYGTYTAFDLLPVVDFDPAF